ncbi:MAG: TRAP transporter small permease subunit [Deltaproteobacteria bacterium]|nr:TRAP transporter small permease subunit [Deltaproteobacteria bacterium]
MEKFFKWIDRMNEWIGTTVSYFIIILVCVILYEIFVRYLLNSPTIWAHEVSQMVYGVYVILLGGFLQQRDGHVSVEILYLRFKPRTRAVINLFTWLLFFIFCGTLLVKGSQMAWDSFSFRETEPTAFAPPVYPVKMMIPLGAFLLLLQGLVKYLRDIRTVITGKEETT